MKKFLVFVLVVAIVGGAAYYLFPGLFVEVPTDGMAESAVAKMVAGQSKDIEIELFQKTDGQERTDEKGVRRYALDYKCVAKFKKNTMWSFVAGVFETTDPLPEKAKRKERKAAEARLAGKQPAKAGETVVMKGTVDFESKESGWVATRIVLNRDR
ncbi:MAG: hypothetical protein ACYTF8_16225 [Planctomycetota bacterium]|jgi:hypothetical protein